MFHIDEENKAQVNLIICSSHAPENGKGEIQTQAADEIKHEYIITLNPGQLGGHM